MSASTEPWIEYCEFANLLPEVRALRVRAVALLGLQEGHRVLSVGCGLADDLALMADQVGAKGRVVGVDASETMIDHARKRHPGRELEMGVIESLPHSDEGFDAVYVERLLHLVDDLPGAIAEVERVLDSGGRFVFAEPDFDTFAIASADVGLGEQMSRLHAAARTEWSPGRLAACLGGTSLSIAATHAGGMKTRDFEVARRLFHFDALLDGGVDAGHLDHATAESWLVEARTAADQGRFEVSMSGVIVQGEKAP